MRQSYAPIALRKRLLALGLPWSRGYLSGMSKRRFPRRFPQPLARVFRRSAPNLDAFEAMGRAAYLSIPEPMRRLLGDVVIRVQDFPDDQTMAEMGLASPYDILGLYRGVPVGYKSAGALPGEVDMIFLYRRPILDYWDAGRESLTDVIRHVLIHEIGHHFGLSDEDMERIEAAG
jgi:predicted Zn-dependent protease with MMP-like domain